MPTGISPKALQALKPLEGADIHNTYSAKSLARRLWPEKMLHCHTALRRGGLYRSAGVFYSKLAKKGWVGHWMDDFSSGYYLTKAGLELLRSNTP